MKQRIITAAILLPLAIGWLFFLSFEYFALASALLFFLASREWARFCKVDNQVLFALSYTIILLLSYFFIPITDLIEGQINLFLISILGASVIWWITALGMVIKYPGHERWWQNSLAIQWLFGICTLLPFFWALVALRSHQYQQDSAVGSWALLFVMSLVWLADSGAYFVGKNFGKNKLLPAVSPNKTIEGLMGGVACSLALAVIVTVMTHTSIRQSIAIIVSSVFAVLASVLGDLSESLFKREAGIKDSGSMLPGHGGVMDRIDSLTAALPIFLVVYLLINKV